MNFNFSELFSLRQIATPKISFLMKNLSVLSAFFLACIILLNVNPASSFGNPDFGNGKNSVHGLKLLPSVTELQRYFRDSDQDGRGNAGSDTLADSQPAGFVLDSTDCDDNNPLRFRQTPKPVIRLAGGGTAFCEGETGIIRVISPDSSFVYAWSTGSEGVNLSTQEVDSGGTYFVIATADSGCPAISDSLTLTQVNQLIVKASISISPASSICTGTTVTFNPTIAGGGNDPFYEWFLNDLFVETSEVYTTDSLKNGDQIQLILTSSAGCGVPIVAISQKITMTVEDSLKANAGSDTTACGQDYVLQGNASGFWTVIGGNAQIQDSASATTLVSGLSAAGNRFVWTISGGTCPESKDTVEINSVEPTLADAGFDRILCAASGNLQGNGIQGEGMWTLLSGDISLEDSLNPNSPFSNLAEGNTVLEWKIFAGQFCPETRDTVELNREVAPSQAVAGSDQSICDSSAQLNAAEPLAGQGSWSILSGGGVISRADSSVTSIDSLPEGVTILLWSVSNGICPASTDSLRLEVAFPRKASAGSDQILCDSNAILAGNEPGFSGGAWFILSGAGTLADSSQPNTVVSNLGIGENLLVWTLDNGACDSDQDTVNITRELSPGISIAGEDLEICGTTASLNANFPAVGSGSWNVISGTASLSDSLNPITQLSGPENSVTRLEWVIRNGLTCPSSRDTVEVRWFGAPSQPQAGIDFNACSPDAFLLAQSPQTGTGSWNVLAGDAQLTDSLSPGTAVNNLSVGANSFEWRVQNGVCPSLADTLTVTRFNESISLGPDTILCNGETLNLSLAGEFQNFLWSDGSSSTSLTVDSAGLYFVQVNGAGGCLLSDSIQVGYTICTGTRDLAKGDLSIRVFPNPFQDAFELSVSGASDANMSYRLCGINGAEILRGELSSPAGHFSGKITTGNLPQGLYLLEVRSDSMVQRVRVQIR